MNTDLFLTHADAPAEHRCPSWLAALDTSELHVVERAVSVARRAGLTRVASVATRLGNGWLYLFGLLLLIPARSESVLRCALVSLLSIAVSFLIYPVLKALVKRRRPYERRASLQPEVPALDRYSFPSGHAMTAAACGVPFFFVYSLAAALVVIPIWAIISWSRLALGHHYVSDVVAGTALGISVGCAVALLAA